MNKIVFLLFEWVILHKRYTKDYYIKFETKIYLYHSFFKEIFLMWKKEKDMIVNLFDNEIQIMAKMKLKKKQFPLNVVLIFTMYVSSKFQ